MELTKDEREVIKVALKRYLKEVKKAEGIHDQDLLSLSTEVKYEDFVNKLIEKL